MATNYIAKTVGKGLFDKHLVNYQPADPLYEEYVDKNGKTRRRKRELPPGLSKRDAKLLRKIKWRAHYLDKGFRICGLRFGWTFIIGLIPVVGDVADASINYFLVVRKAKQAEIPDWLVRRMIVNNMVSAGVGFVPLVGDVILATWKANSRNAALLEEFLRIRGEEALKAAGNRVENSSVIKPGAGLEHGERLDASGSAHGGQQSSVVPEPVKKESWYNKRKRAPPVTEPVNPAANPVAAAKTVDRPI